MFAEGTLLVPSGRGAIDCLVETLWLLLACSNLGNWGDDVASIAVFVTHQLVVAIICVRKVGRGLSSTTGTKIVRGINTLGHVCLTSTTYGLRRQRYRQAVIASLLS